MKTKNRTFVISIVALVLLFSFALLLKPTYATAPTVTITSPTATEYVPDTDTPYPYTSSVALTFHITNDSLLVWMRYSLNGASNVTVLGNTTITDLATDTAYTVIMYVNNSANQQAASAAVTFSFVLPSSNVHTILPFFYVAIGLIGLAPLVITVIAFTKMEIDSKIAIGIVTTDIIFILAILVILTFISALS